MKIGPHEIHCGHVLDVLPTLEAQSANCCVTSPPYWGLRDYGVDATVWGETVECDHEWGDAIVNNATNHTDKRRWQHTRNGRDELQPTDKRVAWLRTKVPQGKFCQHCGAWAGSLGLEPTPTLFVEHIVEIFAEVRRVLRDDGTLWMNLGDSYAGGGRGGNPDESPFRKQATNAGSVTGLAKEPGKVPRGCKPKDLVGIPWMVAFALRADGWYLRSDIIWSKPNPMPESVTDRPTKAHEYLFLLSKSERYAYNADAIAEITLYPGDDRARRSDTRKAVDPKCLDNGSRSRTGCPSGDTRNKRTVWTIPTAPYPEAHFATFPPALIEPCILAGSPEGGTVLDPFSGSGTTGYVAERKGRNYVGIELNPEYVELSRKRIGSAMNPLFEGAA